MSDGFGDRASANTAVAAPTLMEEFTYIIAAHSGTVMNG